MLYNLTLRKAIYTRVTRYATEKIIVFYWKWVIFTRIIKNKTWRHLNENKAFFYLMYKTFWSYLHIEVRACFKIFKGFIEILQHTKYTILSTDRYSGVVISFKDVKCIKCANFQGLVQYFKGGRYFKEKIPLEYLIEWKK